MPEDTAEREDRSPQMIVGPYHSGPGKGRPCYLPHSEQSRGSLFPASTSTRNGRESSGVFERLAKVP
jgi:hypothetical protein